MERHGIRNATNTRLARELGVYLIGWSKVGNPSLYYSGLDPFNLTGYINNLAFGFLQGHGLRFDARLTAKADYDISLQNALRHRRCLRDNRNCFESRRTFRNPGGMSLLRNSLTEKRDLEISGKSGARRLVPRAAARRGAINGATPASPRLELRLPF